MSQGYTMPGGAAGMGDTDSVESSSEESIIDRSSAFDGVLRTSRNLRVEGQAKGEIRCEGTLYVDEGAEVNARIVAANITVAGTVNGEITCHGRLQLLPTGRVSGKLATTRLVIQEGAVYEGELRMSNVGEEPAGDGDASSAQVTSGAAAGADQAEKATPALSPAANSNPARATSRRGGNQSADREDEQRAGPAPAGERDRNSDDNR